MRNIRPVALPIVYGMTFICLIVVLVYGFIQERLLSQSVWLLQGLYRIGALAIAFGTTALVAYRFKPKSFLRIIVALAALYTCAAVGLGPVTAAAFTVSATLAIGDLLLTKMGMRRNAIPRPESLVLSFLVGTALLSFGVGVAVHFPINYSWFYALIFGPALWVNRRAIVYYVRPLGTLDMHPVSAARYFSGALLGFVLLAQFLLVLKPEVGYDALATHLFVPSYVANHRMWGFDFRQFVWAVTPMAGAWAYTPPYLLGGEFAARLLNFSFLLAILAAVYCLLRRRLRRGLSVFTLALFVSSPLVQLTTGSLFVENLQGALIIGAVLALDRSRRSREPLYLCCAGILLATAMAVKLSSLPFVLTLTFFGLFQLTNRHLGLYRKLSARRWAAWAFLSLAILILPYAYAWAATGNPLYPFMNDVFRSPYPTVPFESSFKQTFSLTSLYDLTFRTHKYLESQDGAAGFQYILLVPLSLFGFAYVRRSVGVVAAGTAGLVALFFIMRSQPYLRYIYATYPLFTVAGLAPLAQFRRAAPRLVYAFVATCAMLLVLNMYFFVASGWAHKGFGLFALFDHVETEQYIAAMAPSRRLIEYLNLKSPGEPVWFLGPPQFAELIGTPFIASWYQPAFLREVSTARTASDVLAIVKVHGLRHFLVPAEFDQINNAPAIRSFIREYLVEEWQVGKMTLERLRDHALQVLDAPDSKNGWAEWQRNGHVEFGTTGVATVTVTDTLARGIVIDKDLEYRYTVEAACPEPDTTLRLQLNWHDAGGRFIGAALEPRACDREWHSYTTTIRPPREARTGVVIIGGHGPKSVLVRHASLEF